MDKKKILLEKKEQLNNIMLGNDTSKILLFSNIWNWKISDSAIDIKTAYSNYRIQKDIMRRHHEKYQFDMYIDIGQRNPVGVVNTLFKDNPRKYQFNHATQQLLYQKNYCMEYSDYDYIKKHGIKNYYFNLLLSRKFQYKTKEDARHTIKKAITEYQNFQLFLSDVRTMLGKEYGIPTLAAYNKEILPLEFLFCGYRGPHNLIYDLALDRKKHFLTDILDIIDDFYFERFKINVDRHSQEEDAYFPVKMTLLAHNILSRKQIELYVWPYLKRRLDYIQSKNMKLFLFCEGEAKRLVDYFKDVKPGTLALLIESDDPFLIKKSLPNITLIGGFPTAILAYHTKESCIKELENFLEKIAANGRYIFACDRMLTYRDDAKSENVYAINEFIKKNYQ